MSDNHVDNNLEKILMYVYFGSIITMDPKNEYSITLFKLLIRGSALHIHSLTEKICLTKGNEFLRLGT